jgi:hypothetical protein
MGSRPPVGRVERRVAAREGSQPVPGHGGGQQQSVLTATMHKQVAKEREKTASLAMKQKRFLATEEQAENARAIFEARRLHGLPPVAPGDLAMTDGDRHAITLRKERLRLRRLPSDGSSSSSSDSSSSSSSSRPAPAAALALLWDPQSNRDTLELAAAMEDAAFTAEFAETAGLAVDAALAARSRERADADAAAMAPERAENGPGEGASPQSLGTERAESLDRGWSSASVQNQGGQGWIPRPHPQEPQVPHEG